MSFSNGRNNMQWDSVVSASMVCFHLLLCALLFLHYLLCRLTLWFEIFDMRRRYFNVEEESENPFLKKSINQLGS